jgi:hypothetical protein
MTAVELPPKRVASGLRRAVGVGHVICVSVQRRGGELEGSPSCFDVSGVCL